MLVLLRFYESAVGASLKVRITLIRTVSLLASSSLLSRQLQDYLTDICRSAVAAPWKMELSLLVTVTKRNSNLGELDTYTTFNQHIILHVLIVGP